MQILVVDDSSVARRLIARSLRGCVPDACIHEAPTGDAALELVKTLERPIELAILDYNMPGINGLELADRMHQRFPAAHLVLCTANVQQPLVERVEAHGVSFLAKPITEAKLRGVLACT